MDTDIDIQLMLRFQGGDEGAFQQLFEKYRKRAINFCYRYCGHQSVAEDLSQEIFLRIYKAGPSYRPAARFSTWFFRIAVNVCLNELRKPVYRVRIESMDQGASPHSKGEGGEVKTVAVETERSLPDRLLEARENEAEIHRALDRLPEPQRAALLLRSSEGFSYEEIGRQMRCSESRVKTLIHRGRKKMRTLLTPLWRDHESE